MATKEQNRKSDVENRQDEVLRDVELVLRSALANHDVYGDKEIERIEERGLTTLRSIVGDPDLRVRTWRGHAIGLGVGLLLEAAEKRSYDTSV